MINKNDIKKKLRKNKALLKQYNIKKIGLFGSFARNEQSENSDIDFLVEFTKIISLLKHAQFQNKLSDIFDREIDVISSKAIKPMLRDYIFNEVEWFEGL